MIKHSIRFKDAPWFSEEPRQCIIGGAGGIGSWLSLFLSRANIEPIIYDFDLIEDHNIGGQMFNTKDINSLKVTAIATKIKEYSNIDINFFTEAYSENSLSSEYMFSAFDNMKAREIMFNNWCSFVDSNKENTEFFPIFVDGRLTAEQMQIFCVLPENIQQYREHLFHDSEVPDAPCTMKQTTHAAAMIASHMVGFFTNHLTNVAMKEKDRNFPFMWEYFIPINYINEQNTE